MKCTLCPTYFPPSYIYRTNYSRHISKCLRSNMKSEGEGAPQTYVCGRKSSAFKRCFVWKNAQGHSTVHRSQPSWGIRHWENRITSGDCRRIAWGMSGLSVCPTDARIALEQLKWETYTISPVEKKSSRKESCTFGKHWVCGTFSPPGIYLSVSGLLSRCEAFFCLFVSFGTLLIIPPHCAMFSIDVFLLYIHSFSSSF